MQLDLGYPEIQLIRTLVNKHRQDMFKQLMTRHPRLKKLSIDELSEMNRKFNEERNPFCDEGRCGVILDKIEEVDNKIHGALNG